MLLHCDKCGKLKEVKSFSLSGKAYGTNLLLCHLCMTGENAYRRMRNLTLEEENKFILLVWDKGKELK